MEVTMEEDVAALAGTAFCDVVLEQAPEHGEAVVAAPLFAPTYMTRPIIAMIAMTIAATTATATPARDCPNLILNPQTVTALIRHNTMPRPVQNTLLKGNPKVSSHQVFV
jgi:hypothetical protein